MPWALQTPMLTATVWHLLVNDTEGVLGNLLRGAMGTHPECIIKVALFQYYLKANAISVPHPHHHLTLTLTSILVIPPKSSYR